MDATLPSPAWVRKFQTSLIGWYRRHARVLPWRETREAYAVWVSEIMLQQTQVATVIPYFERFLARFPTVAALAAASEHEVLKLWEGLGYYRRARQLHAAAREIAEVHRGRFPESAVAVRLLPGIGRYTAGAILSIAFDAREPILEANTQRLFARLIAFRGAIKSKEGQAALWKVAAYLLPDERCGEFNQALMELGSLVCTPRSPNCEACPVRSLCPTRKNGWQGEIPAPAPAKRYENVREVAVIVRRQAEVLLRQCGAGERLAGMWDFPRFEVRDGSPVSFKRLKPRIVAALGEQAGLRVMPEEKMVTLKHTITRYRITLDVVVASTKASRLKAKSAYCWFPLADLAGLPFSSTGRKIARLACALPTHAP